MITLLAGAGDTRAPSVLFGNVFAQGALVASSAAADGFAANALGPQTFDFWKPTAMPATLTVTLAAAATVDALALVAHDLAARAVAVTLAYSVTDVSGFLTVGTFTPPDADTNLLLFPAVTGRRFRLSLAGATAPAIGVAMLGRRLVFPADVQPPYRPLALSGRVDVIGAQSLSGQHLGNRWRRRAASGAVNLSAMPRDWFDGADALAFADHYNTGKPFVWSADPAGLPRDCAYSWRSSGAAELVPEIQPGAIHAAFGMELEAYVG